VHRGRASTVVATSSKPIVTTNSLKHAGIILLVAFISNARRNWVVAKLILLLDEKLVILQFPTHARYLASKTTAGEQFMKRRALKHIVTATFQH
jgi:hypothetical protein